MSNDLASLLLDIVILVLLGATIFYVHRLTQGLAKFKQHRQEFDSVIANLLSSIDQADHSVRMLKKVSMEEANRLEEYVTQAKALSEELKIITESGEGMAKRLEKLAETNRKIIQPSHGAMFSRKNQRRYDATLKHVEKKETGEEQDLPSFMKKNTSVQKDASSDEAEILKIRLDTIADNKNKRDSINKNTNNAASNNINDTNNVNDMNDVNKDVIIPKKPQSQAEKELLAALRSTRKNILGKE